MVRCLNWQFWFFKQICPKRVFPAKNPNNEDQHGTFNARINRHSFSLYDFFMFFQIFISPQVKQCAIITYKHGIYELPHELQNNLRSSEIRKNPENGKTSYIDSLVNSHPAQTKPLSKVHQYRFESNILKISY